MPTVCPTAHPQRVPMLTGRQGHCGAPEDRSGYPKSPPSRSCPANVVSKHRPRSPTTASSDTKGASRTIAKECERLLCGDMKRIFLPARADAPTHPRSMGSIFGGAGTTTNKKKKRKKERDDGGGIFYESDDSDLEDQDDDEYDDDDDDDDGDNDDDDDQETRFIEVWDYIGGTSFRGFIADKQAARGRVEKTLFLFFEHVADTQLKHGYVILFIRRYPTHVPMLIAAACRLMALIELATECFACDRLVICLERNAQGLCGSPQLFPTLDAGLTTRLQGGLMRDLGWVGFELVTLAHWVPTDLPGPAGPGARCGSFSSVSSSSSVFSDDDITSEKWLFMGMEL